MKNYLTYKRNSKLNITNLIHSTVQLRLADAMRRTAHLKQDEISIYNYKGVLFLTCEYLKGVDAWDILGVSSGFLWSDRYGNDVTDVVEKSLVRCA